MAIVIPGCATDNSGRPKNRRNAATLHKKTAAVAAMTQALPRCGKDRIDCRSISCGPDVISAVTARAAASSRSTVLFGALGGAKLHTEAGIRTPDDVARLLEAVVANHENKIVRYTNLACHLEAGAGNRYRRRC